MAWRMYALYRVPSSWCCYPTKYGELLVLSFMLSAYLTCVILHRADSGEGVAECNKRIHY